MSLKEGAMKKILVAVDGSEPSQRAVRLAANIALKFGAHLTLTHVLSPLWIPPEVYGLSIDAIQQAHAKEGQKLVTEAEKKVQASGLHIERVVLEGVPADAVADYAKTNGYDLVVIGSRGQGAMSRVLLGSVSDRLAHVCQVPLLIVH
jgi:nucleotide-binding universal stress UspA family protein